jgi:uncharacterized membrane protein YdjX (TVP38/TMEM64 family)
MRVLRIVVPLCLVAAAIAFHSDIARAIEELASWVATLGPWGPIVFVAGYVAAVLALVPGAVLTIAAGAVFGVAAGTAYVFIAASLAACAAFLLGRGLLRGWVEHRLARDARFTAVDRAIGEQGLWIVFLLRLSPLFPFAAGNYLLGLTRVRFRDYALACVGMLPWTFVYVYLGSVAGSTGLGWKLAIGLPVTAVVVFLIARAARRALAEATGETELTRTSTPGKSAS